ncbi:MAG: isocitrate lyase/PEP mutase family protein [Alphaproteobacteria bacterium]|nr:isocitrate lyase/PEP mutase family protein [Alphaproteobacteria bacterium]
MSKARRLRQLLKDEATVVSPGVYDCYSALMVEAMGFKTCAVSGSALSNALIGQPDIGLLSLRENVDACRHMARTVSIPMMADADTGYGNAVSVYHVVQYFEEAGIVGINIEDQFSPKRCGHMRGKELIEPDEMAKKIEAAVMAKKDPDFILNARTDALAVAGLDKTIERLKLYVKAGADMVYPDAVHSEEEIKRITDALPGVPVNIGMGFGVRSRPTTPLISLPRMKELGIARASMPRLMSGAALMGMKKALEVMLDCMATGKTADRPDLLVGIEEITQLVGYERINKLEQALLLEDQLEKKYGDEERDYVIRKSA